MLQGFKYYFILNWNVYIIALVLLVSEEKNFYEDRWMVWWWDLESRSFIYARSSAEKMTVTDKHSYFEFIIYHLIVTNAELTYVYLVCKLVCQFLYLAWRQLKITAWYGDHVKTKIRLMCDQLKIYWRQPK